MELTVNIQAHELAEAIKFLALTLSNNKDTHFEQGINQPGVAIQRPVTLQPAVTAAAPMPIQQPVQTAIPTAPVQHPIQQAPVQQQAHVVPTSAPTYTMDQLAVAATQLMDAGRQNELLSLLASFGVQSLMALPQEQYGTFATKLRELGANL